MLTCHNAGIAVTLPKPMTSGIEAKGRFGKQHFVYLSDEDVCRCPAGEKFRYYYTNEENGQKLRRYWTNACRHCALKHRCTTGVQRRITRWDHEHVVEAVQKRLDVTTHPWPRTTLASRPRSEKYARNGRRTRARAIKAGRYPLTRVITQPRSISDVRCNRLSSLYPTS
jgi:Transposase DDE domain